MYATIQYSLRFLHNFRYPFREPTRGMVGRGGDNEGVDEEGKRLGPHKVAVRHPTTVASVSTF